MFNHNNLNIDTPDNSSDDEASIPDPNDLFEDDDGFLAQNSQDGDSDSDTVSNTEEYDRGPNSFRP